MTTRDVLVAAKGYLLEHGWMQGDFGEHGAPRCIVGVLGSVSGVVNPRDNEWPQSMYRALVAVEDAASIDTYCDNIANWNDDGGRTFEQVIDAIDRAIVATASKTPEVQPLHCQCCGTTKREVSFTERFSRWLCLDCFLGRGGGEEL
jgi:hypothetical protein